MSLSTLVIVKICINLIEIIAFRNFIIFGKKYEPQSAHFAGVVMMVMIVVTMMMVMVVVTMMMVMMVMTMMMVMMVVTRASGEWHDQWI